MGGKKINAPPAEKKSLCANMANADISAKIVGGKLIVSIIVSETIAETAAGSPYVCINARFTSVLFAIGNVNMAKGAVDAISVK